MTNKTVNAYRDDITGAWLECPNCGFQEDYEQDVSTDNDDAFIDSPITNYQVAL